MKPSNEFKEATNYIPQQQNQAKVCELQDFCIICEEQAEFEVIDIDGLWPFCVRCAMSVVE